MQQNIQGIAQIVVPKMHGLREVLMQELHKTAIAGHVGSRRLLEALFQCVWWLKVRQQVAKYVAACTVCAGINNATTKQPGLL